MQVGDIDKLQKYVAKEYKIEECRMEFLRTVQSLKAKIDEVEKKAIESTQIDQQFYEANHQKLKQVQKHLNILTVVAEKLRAENFQNFDLVKRNLLTTYNRQAHRFNMLIPEKVKARMRKSKLFSKLMVKDDEQEQAKEESEEKKENEEFEEIIQKLSFYLTENESFSRETSMDVIIGEKEQSEVVYVNDKQESSDHEEKIKKEKIQSLKKIQQQAQNRLSDEQKRARNDYKWFLRRESATMSLKYICLCVCIFFILLIGIAYLLLRKAYYYFGEL